MEHAQCPARSGHQSRFLCPRVPPVNGHLPGPLSSVFASISPPRLSCLAAENHSKRSRAISSNRFTSSWRSDLLDRSMISLKQLRYFSAVARTGHFGDGSRAVRGDAARSLHADPGPGEGTGAAAARARPQGRQPHTRRPRDRRARRPRTRRRQRPRRQRAPARRQLSPARCASAPSPPSRPTCCRSFCRSSARPIPNSICTCAKRRPRSCWTSWSTVSSTSCCLRCPSSMPASRPCRCSTIASSSRCPRRARSQAACAPRPTCCAATACCCSRKAIACAIRRSPSATCARSTASIRSAPPACRPSCRWSPTASASRCCPRSASLWKPGVPKSGSCASPSPSRSRVLGLAWRATSPRKRDFVELGKLIASVAQRRRLPKSAA